MKLRWALIAVAACAVAALATIPGCATFSYYGQAVRGHLDLMNRIRPIDAQLADGTTSPELRAKLARVLEIREFASRELGLPENGSYRAYADLERPYAVWNVFAAPEFSVEPRASCFPIVGCVSYRGYYAQGDAEAFAAGLRKEGYDVFVYGVPAYSTLGWFDDPVLNTFVRYPDAELARLVFHELAHQLVYVKGDTMFNESFAVAVEEEGVRRWMAKHATERERAAYAELRARRNEFVRLVLRYRARLDDFYREALPAEEKRAGKARLLAEMEAEYRALKAERWGGWSGYDRWFENGVNNAQLASVATYEELVPAFRALLAREGRDMARFYGAVKALAQLDKSAREAELAALARQPAAGPFSRSGRSHARTAACATPIATSAAA
ncbi:MAG TPA: aminopeptidase [Burkholderiales bacterium]|nr:aminopeptidase [Burkholderiales bacterium]